MKENDIVIVDATGDISHTGVVDKMICRITNDECYGNKCCAAVQPINNGDIQNFHSRAAGRYTWVINKKYLRLYEEGDIYV